MSDSRELFKFDFKVEVFNDPPYFVTEPLNKMVILGDLEYHQLPDAEDPE